MPLYSRSLTIQSTIAIVFFSQDLAKCNLLQLIQCLHSLKEAQIITLSTSIDEIKTKLDPPIEQCKQRSHYYKELFLIKAKPLFDIHELQFQLKAHAVEQETGPISHTNNEQCGSAASSTGSTYLSKNTNTNTTKGIKQQDHLNQATKRNQIDCMKNNMSPRDRCDNSKREGKGTTYKTNNIDHTCHNRDNKMNTNNQAMTIGDAKATGIPLMGIYDPIKRYANITYRKTNNIHLSLGKCKKQALPNNSLKQISSNNNRNKRQERNEKRNEGKLKSDLSHIMRLYANSFKPSFKDIKMHNVLHNLRTNKDTVILKPDKGTGVVRLNRGDYNRGIMDIKDDSRKLIELVSDPTISTEGKLRSFLGILNRRVD